MFVCEHGFSLGFGRRDWGAGGRLKPYYSRIMPIQHTIYIYINKGVPYTYREPLLSELCQAFQRVAMTSVATVAIL